MRLRYKSVKYNKLNPIIFHTPSMAKFSKKKEKGCFVISYAPLEPYPLKNCKN